MKVGNHPKPTAIAHPILDEAPPGRGRNSPRLPHEAPELPGKRYGEGGLAHITDRR